METARLTSWLRACNVSVLLLSAIYWFSDDPINGMRMTYWLLLALPWLVALFMPSGKVKIAAGLVLAGSGVLAPIIVLFQVLAPPGSHRSGTDWLLLVAMGASSIFAFILVVTSSIHRRDDVLPSPSSLF
jgi:hypothetical protein